MSEEDLPEEAKAALKKLLGGEALSSEEEALLQQHQDKLGIQANDD
jgi:uncharacterized coiled-coil DUF342 family protein